MKVRIRIYSQLFSSNSFVGDIEMKKTDEVCTHKKEQGQSLVELSISLVILLILAAGLVDLGRAFFTYITLRDAAQEGASYAAVSIAETSEMQNSTQVSNYCSGITSRVLATTTDLSGNTPESNGPINLQSLSDAGEVAVQTQINGTDCTSMSPTNICMGGAVSVRVTYGSFPLTMPFMGAILGTQSINLSAVVVDTILTPACQ
jgi:Flp pilus assembly protein TadG